MDERIKTLEENLKELASADLEIVKQFCKMRGINLIIASGKIFHTVDGYISTLLMNPLEDKEHLRKVKKSLWKVIEACKSADLEIMKLRAQIDSIRASVFNEASIRPKTEQVRIYVNPSLSAFDKDQTPKISDWEIKELFSKKMKNMILKSERITKWIIEQYTKNLQERGYTDINSTIDLEEKIIIITVTEPFKQARQRCLSEFVSNNSREIESLSAKIQKIKEGYKK